MFKLLLAVAVIAMVAGSLDIPGMFAPLYGAADTLANVADAVARRDF